MEEALLKLLQNSPWVALAVGLVWRLVKTQDTALEAYKAGADSARVQSDSISSAVSTLESIERRQALTEAAVLRIEEALRR